MWLTVEEVIDETLKAYKQRCNIKDKEHEMKSKRHLSRYLLVYPVRSIQGMSD